jgi:two-component system CheB/CheR fusion protein
LQSTNEELQTSKEELESANEELNTVNEEMMHRNQQLSQAYNDLANLLNSVNIPIVMLGPDLSVRRFTPQSEQILGFSANEVGRVITNLKLKLNISELEQSAVAVMRDITPKQLPLKDEKGRQYTLRITPYRTSDNKIDGVVLILLDLPAVAAPSGKARK